MTQTQVTVTIENLAPDGGTFITPAWVGFHDGNFDLYNRGEAASPELERIAEDGNTTPISELFLNQGDGTVDGTILGTEGIEGPIDPGELTSQTFILESEDATSRYFSYASMILPSNDAFIANGDPLANPIFDDDGNFIGVDFLVLGTQVLDAGTEVNDELVDTTAFFSQSVPDTGVVENGVVEIHPGFLEGGRILTEDGSSENALAPFNNADFTADGYQVARFTVSIIDDAVELSSSLDGSQEIEGGDDNATGTSSLTLNEVGNALEYTLTVFGLDFGANGLIEGGAETEDINDDVTRIHIHNGARGENGPIVFSLFDVVTPDLGNVLGISGNQDDDLAIVSNDDGSVTLSGIWDGTDLAETSLLDFVSDIRGTEEDADVDLYWNIHTEEFPGGAIRGQILVDEEENPEDILDTPFTRFQNSDISGTYLFATGGEAQTITQDFPNFVEEGIGFNASLEDEDDLVSFFRFQNLQNPGTYLFVTEAERTAINQDANLANLFDDEGLAFYAYGAGSDEATAFTRFRNDNIPGAYLYAAGAEANNIRANFPNFVDEGVAFEAVLA